MTGCTESHITVLRGTSLIHFEINQITNSFLAKLVVKTCTYNTFITLLTYLLACKDKDQQYKVAIIYKQPVIQATVVKHVGGVDT